MRRFVLGLVACGLVVGGLAFAPAAATAGQVVRPCAVTYRVHRGNHWNYRCYHQHGFRYHRR